MRFFLANGLSAFNQNYPYWYLGSTPFKYLIGPVVPALFSLGNLLAPEAGIFTILIYLVIFGIILSGVGWILLFSKIFELKRRFSFYLLPFALYLLFPWKYIAGFTMDEASSFLAKCLLPFVLVTVWSYIKRKDLPSLLTASLASCGLILTHSGAVTGLFIGSVSLGIAFSLRDGKMRSPGKKIKSSLAPLLLGFLLSVGWYGPGFWLRILSNPGIGGRSGIGAIVSALGFLRTIIPLALAFFVVYFKSKFKDKMELFIWLWLGTFTFISIYRFISNPAFYMDWVSWFVEIEEGMFLLSFYLFCGKKYAKSALTFAIPALITLIFYNSTGRPTLVSKTPPPIINSVIELSKTAGNNRVFVTGSSVFWLNALTDTPQVRGGVDEVSVDPIWYKSSYEIRESKDTNRVKAALEKTGVAYVLLNTDTSTDFYKDYKNLVIWGSIGERVFSKSGDEIFKISPEE